LIAKKHYVKCVYSAKKGDHIVPKLKTAGILTRGMCPYTMKTIQAILEAFVLKGGTVAEVEGIIHSSIQALYSGTLTDMKDFTYSANLSKPLKEYPKDTVHTIAAKQMIEDRLRVEAGDRVEYYICKLADKSTSKSKQKVSDYVVAAHRIGSYKLHWSKYVQKLIKSLDANIAPLLERDLKYLTKKQNYDVKICMPDARPKTRPIEETLLDRVFQPAPKKAKVEEDTTSAAAAADAAAPALAPSTILPSGPRSMFSYAQRTSTTVQPIKKSTAGSRKRAAAEMQRTNVSIDQFVVRRERVKKTKDSSPNKELVR